MRRAGATELDSSQGKYLLITPDMSEDLLDHSTCRYPEESLRKGGTEGRRKGGKLSDSMPDASLNSLLVSSYRVSRGSILTNCSMMIALRTERSLVSCSTMARA